MRGFSKLRMNVLGVALATALLLTGAPRIIAQGPPQGGPPPRFTPPPPPKPGPVQLDIQDGQPLLIALRNN
jgi:hypothetical protein